jgi:metal-responsive CopG/Arc/MetJ family transcriptional regulator
MPKKPRPEQAGAGMRRGAVSAIELGEKLTRAIDSWAAEHGVSHSAAIRHLLEQALAAARAPAKDSRVRAAKLASDAIDKITASSASAAERQKRKHRLVKGPREFRDIRGHRSNAKH